jgi:hypothetical protein
MSSLGFDRLSIAPRPSVAILSAANLPPANVRPLTSYEHVTFVNEEATEALACPVCTCVAFDPPNQTCPHVHCRSCLERAGRCSICRASWSSQAPSNGFVQHAIYQLRVKCKWHVNGCEWQSELGTNNRNLLEHLQQCQERPVKCEACGKRPRARRAATHPDRCEARMVRCSDCKEEMKHKEYMAHRTPVAAAAAASDGMSQAAAAVAPCNKSSLCRTGCTDAQGRITVLPTSQLRAHENLNCERRRVPCDDCEQFVEARHLDNHQSLECLMRLVKCEHCKGTMEFRLWAEHRRSPDAKAGVPCRGFVLCENRCKKADSGAAAAAAASAEGGTLVQLRPHDVAAHKVQCPLRQVACDLCHTLMLWSAVDAHRRQQCMQRVVTCHHCGDSLTWAKLQNEHLKKQHHKKGAHAPVARCASLQICALGCKKEHRKDVFAAHAAECTHRPSECPCCNPTVQLKYCDVMAHVKQRLADGTQHDKMASLLIRLAKENKQGLQSAQRKSADAVHEARKEQHAFAMERQQWHAQRDKNDKIHQRNRMLAEVLIQTSNLCRAFFIFDNCPDGASRCKYSHRAQAEMAASHPHLYHRE